MYLLDTNVISETRKARPHPGVLSWLEGVRGHPSYLSAATLGELQAGAERTRRQDPAKAAEIEAWIDRLEGATKVLPVDSAVFRAWARLMVGIQLEHAMDVMIAATAQVHGLIVVTRNVRDFASFGVRVVNPFAV